MACGCKKSAHDNLTTPGVRLTVIHERAAMCHFCPRAEHGPSFWRDGAVSCGATGRGIMEHLAGAACPLGKHPGGDGVTRWLGVRWYGVPYPLRVLLYAFGASHRRPGVWGGCGCVVRLKSILGRLMRS